MTAGSRRRLSVVKLAMLAGLALLVGACAADAPQDSLEPEGPIAREIDNLINPVFLIAGVIFVFVNLGVLVILRRYRARRAHDEDDGPLPKQVHGNLKAELTWTIVPTLILTVVAVMTVAAIFRIDRADADADMQVQVIGKQWWWEYRYDINGDGTDDIITANDLVIPAAEPVVLDITAADVIHSYWIPKLNGKMDAVPGRNHRLVLETDEPGTFMGQCTEFCGLSHGYMRQRVVALEHDEFEDWVSNQLEDAQMPAEGTPAREGADLFTQVCSACHLARGINDAEFEEAGEGEALVAGRAPDLTHFMTRGSFAGALFDLWLPSDPPVVKYEDIGDELNREDLAAWLRDPPAEKPMDPDDGRGMPNFNLTEEDIDVVIAFLETLD
jgi:cytochrome c oxidase subunit II